MAADVRVICAIGRSGQLGLNGHLPWEGNPGRPFVEDVERFFEISRGHVLVAGPTTIGAVPDFARETRTLVTIRSHEDPREVLSRFPDRVVFIGGGPKVWDVYAPFVRHWDVNVLPYDGEADRWFDPAWLLAGGAARRG
ncbi:diacylglycerol kinase [Antarcticirhabdus aurantiaca]|uniref:Diacylglycerol kinase n=1 Tax=Antarcticirhabdus aurantiaca TaxID=2606717 RepID=A0ACD4NS12_9HYPH|nr:diacylglycerol kinase [Antarcticirhabdus aurantiaca]WAJ29589.1 diacylglycerol kinase [Jeongeuplla avenae]